VRIAGDEIDNGVALLGREQALDIVKETRRLDDGVYRDFIYGIAVVVARSRWVSLRSAPSYRERPNLGPRLATAPAAVYPLAKGTTQTNRRNPMRASLLALTVLAGVVASGASAQQMPAPAPFMSNKDIMALVDKAKSERKGDAPLVVVPIIQLAPYRVMLEYRPGTSPAAVHEKDAELMIVLDGTGNIVTGGKLVDEKRTNANNLSGPSISGGKSQAVVKGDTVLVPANTAHQVIPTGGAPIVLMTWHVPFPPAGWPPTN
jgi:mannose-6-phosphate isomerase-like protein (cupin superfamily)